MTQATQIQWTLRLEIRTGAGAIQTQELMAFSRPAKVTSAQEIGLTLAEAKGLLSHLQQRVVEAQLAQHAAWARPCPHCQELQPVKDYQRRRLQTLFGTVEFPAARFKACPCQPPPAGARRVTTVCPLSDLLPRRATPELERLQAELGAKSSFREAARTLATLLPTAATSHASVRNRVWAVAQRLEEQVPPPAQDKPNLPADSAGPNLAVTLDSAYVRATAACPNRHWEVITGKVEAPGQPSRRFGLVSAGTDDPSRPIRSALLAQGWQPGQPLTVLTDGDPSLPTLVRAAADQAEVEHVLDWFHLSMRVRHIEQAVQGLYGLQPRHPAPLDYAAIYAERLRYLLWNGYYEEAYPEVLKVAHFARELCYLNGSAFEEKTTRLAQLCEELKSYIWNNRAALIDYGHRQREGKPISTAGAEGTVNQLVNARLNRGGQMRWSAQGAHRVLQVRAAVLDGRLHAQTLPVAA